MRPDAVLCPATLRRGPTKWHRLDSVLRIVEPILQVDKEAGELAWVRKQGPDGPDQRLFITRDPNDLLEYPSNHPTKAGRPRYTWVESGPGFCLGYLNEP